MVTFVSMLLALFVLMCIFSLAVTRTSLDPKIYRVRIGLAVYTFNCGEVYQCYFLFWSIPILDDKTIRKVYLAIRRLDNRVSYITHRFI